MSTHFNSQETAAIHNIHKIIGVGRSVKPICMEIGSQRAEYIAIHTVGKHETIQSLRNLLSAEMPFSMAADDEHTILVPLEAAMHPEAQHSQIAI